MKRKASEELSFRLQKPLSTFLEEKEDIAKESNIENHNIDEIDEKTRENEIDETRENEIDRIYKIIHRENEIDEKIIEKRLSNQIETDYYEKSRIEMCVKKIQERFNVDIKVLPVRYGRNQKIYGYYMLITVKGKGYDHIVEFIRNECNLKVYT